jgi:hypothetical protein
MAVGPNEKLSIFTSAVEASFSCALAVKLPRRATTPPRLSTPVAIKLAMNTLLLMIYLPLFLF